MGWGYQFREYVPVAARRARAQKEMDKLRKQGQQVQPVCIAGRTIAASFWGKGWCGHLESFSDYENRLPRGRTYVRNGSVCHLAVQPGKIEAFVSGTELYRVGITVQPLDSGKWERIVQRCAGQIASLIELLQGKLSSEVMRIVTEQNEGLFPLPREIRLACSCPDSAVMCKHVAAVLYGVGSRLDTDPGLLFLLRGVDPQALIAAGISLPDGQPCGDNALSDDSLSDIFGIEFADTTALTPASAPASSAPPAPKTSKPARGRKAAAEALPKADHGKARARELREKSAPAPTSPPESVSPVRESAAVATRKAKRAVFAPTGPRIAGLRKRLGLEPADFAERLGVSAASVYRWENIRGRVNLQSRTLEALKAMHAALHDEHSG